jgi:hypothetical protein
MRYTLGLFAFPHGTKGGPGSFAALSGNLCEGAGPTVRHSIPGNDVSPGEAATAAAAPEHAASGGRAWSRTRTAALFFACFLASTYGIGIAGRLYLPPPPIPELTTKIGTIGGEAQTIDTIAIGSSRMLHAFDPDRFDAAARDAGCTVHSYNLGIGGMNIVEMRYVLRQLAAQHLPRLTRVLFDPPNDIHIQFANLKSQRVWVTTDPRDAGTAIADILSHPDPRKYSSLVRYVAAFLYHNSALGLLSRYLQPMPADVQNPGVSPRRGYCPLDPAGPLVAERAGMLHDIDNFVPRIRQLHDVAIGAVPPPAIAAAQETRRIAVIRGMADYIRTLGYQPLIMSLPDTYGEALTDADDLETTFDKAEGALPTVNFMGKADADTIYETSSWYDWAHVNQDVAGYISTTAADRLCRRFGSVFASVGR